MRTPSVFLCVVALSCIAASGAVATYIPKDLDDAHRQLEKLLSREDIRRIRTMKTEDEMSQYHFGLGMGLRNDWGLWRGSRLSAYFNEIGVHHPDDISAIILDTFWCKLHGKPFRVRERIAYFQAYWRSVEKPKARSPRDGAKIAWVITKGSGRETVHLGISASDRSYWRYEYGKGKIVPATPEDTKALDDLRKTWKEVGSREENFFRD